MKTWQYPHMQICKTCHENAALLPLTKISLRKKNKLPFANTWIQALKAVHLICVGKAGTCPSEIQHGLTRFISVRRLPVTLAWFYSRTAGVTILTRVSMVMHSVFSDGRTLQTVRPSEIDAHISPTFQISAAVLLLAAGRCCRLTDTIVHT